MHLVNTGRALSYLMESVTATAALGSRARLRSASSCRYEQPRTQKKFGERAFAFAGLYYWNTYLPTALQEQSNTATFKRHLKTFLFEQACVLIFGRQFVKGFVLCYRTVVGLSCPVCLSACHVGVLRPNGWME